MAKKEKSNDFAPFLYIGLAGVSFYAIRKIMTNAKKEEVLKNVINDESAALATRIAQAFNPSGYALLKNTDGTDTTALFQALREIKPNILQQVYYTYKGLTNKNLIEDLQNELSAEDYKKALAILKGSGNRPPIIKVKPKTNPLLKVEPKNDSANVVVVPTNHSLKYLNEFQDVDDSWFGWFSNSERWYKVQVDYYLKPTNTKRSFTGWLNENDILITN